MTTKDRIKEIEEDIRRLYEMKEIHEGTSLSGNHYTDIIDELDLQLKYCNDLLYNLKTKRATMKLEITVLHDLYNKYVDMSHRTQTLLEESVATGNWNSALIYDIEKNVYNNVVLDIEEILKEVNDELD